MLPIAKNLILPVPDQTDRKTSHKIPKKKKNYNACKPDSVFLPRAETITIYLGQYSRTASRCQPTCIGRATLRRMLIWHFSTQGLPAYHVAMISRSLLHYIFTLTLSILFGFTPKRDRRGGNFLWHFLSAVLTTNAYPLGSVLLYAVRTFLRNR
jgi:hypothetical protein